MGFVKDFFGEGELIDVVAGGQGDFLDIFGRQEAQRAAEAQAAQEEAAGDAILEERRAREAAQGFLEPFAGVTQRAVDLSGFLADPQAQFDFLQNNPLFQSALQNANQSTMRQAAARGRISAGDTLEQLTQNTLLAASPLIDRQRADISNLLNLGTGIAQTQGNIAIGEGTNVGGLLTNIGDIKAAGQVAQNQINQQALGNLAQIAGTVFSFSDPRLKTNIRKVSIDNGYNVYQWHWNQDAFDKFGLTGETRGVMSTEVREKNPDAVKSVDGYDIVNYGMIGVKYG